MGRRGQGVMGSSSCKAADDSSALLLFAEASSVGVAAAYSSSNRNENYGSFADPPLLAVLNLWGLLG